MAAGSAAAPILTRTEMTAGFTLATMSAKPTGCGSVVSAARADGVPKSKPRRTIEARTGKQDDGAESRDGRQKGEATGAKSPGLRGICGGLSKS